MEKNAAFDRLCKSIRWSIDSADEARERVCQSISSGRGYVIGASRSMLDSYDQNTHGLRTRATNFRQSRLFDRFSELICALATRSVIAITPQWIRPVLVRPYSSPRRRGSDFMARFLVATTVGFGAREMEQSVLKVCARIVQWNAPVASCYNRLRVII